MVSQPSNSSKWIVIDRAASQDFLKQLAGLVVDAGDQIRGAGTFVVVNSPDNSASEIHVLWFGNPEACRDGTFKLSQRIYGQPLKPDEESAEPLSEYEPPRVRCTAKQSDGMECSNEAGHQGWHVASDGSGTWP